MTNLTTKIFRPSKILDVYKNLCQLPIYFGERIYYKKYKTTNIPSLHQKRILIAGNGPSLNDIDLNLLKNKDIELLCVNFFALKHPDFFKIKPRYYCLIDPAFYDEKSNDNDVKELYYILNKIDWDMGYICLSHQNTKKITNKHIKIIKLSPIKYIGKYSRYSIYQKNKGTPGAINVLISALYFAITANADIIYLAGSDFSLHLNLRVDKNNISYDNTKHFYSPNINVKSHDSSTESFSDSIESYASALKEFKYVADYAKYKHVKIINTTVDSFIDAFDKIPYENIGNY